MKKPIQQFIGVAGVALCGVLSGCATQSLAGTWEVRWLDGRKDTVTIQDFGAHQWYLNGVKSELNGVYIFEKPSLTSVKPDLPTMNGFSWRKGPDGSFTLVTQPDIVRLHDHWLGATMVRVPAE